MREEFTVEQVNMRRTSVMVEVPDVYRFTPTGKFKGIKRFAWEFLHKNQCLTPHHGMEEKIERFAFDKMDFIERLYEQKRSVFQCFNKEASVLLIGSEDFQELMQTRYVNSHLTFNVDVLGAQNQILGLEVQVIPWMKGCVVLP